jgi:hypothetical protein
MTAGGVMPAAPDFVVPLEVPLPQVAEGLVVRPANVGQIARLMAVATPVVNMLMDLPPRLLDRMHAHEGDEQLNADDIAELFDLLSRHPHKLLELVAIATALDMELVKGLPPDRFAYLFAVVVQVNADFFSRATPAFSAAGRVLQQATDGAKPGPAPSTS